MDFGLQLAGMPTRVLIDAARRAEDLGFGAVYVPDHFANEPPGSGRLDDQTPMWEALTILGALATCTSRVRLGGHVLCNLFRHPALAAQAIATLDNVSEGRAVLGIGAGWTKNEFDMTGVPFPDIKPRLRMLDESVRVIKSLWTEKRTNFDGEFYHLRDAFLAAKPVQDPHPPVLFGGSGKGLLRIAAREADVVNVIVDTGRAGTVLPSEIAKLSEDGFREKLDFVRREAKTHGREPTLSTTIFVLAVTDKSEEAAQIASAMAAGFGLDPDEVRRMPIALVGTADECAEELRRREREWGISHLIVSAASGLPVVERFATEVLPKL
jgi:probable F420-dependent oxidoreductase